MRGGHSGIVVRGAPRTAWLLLPLPLLALSGVLAALIWAPTASANHSLTELISAPPGGGGGGSSVSYSGASRDGTRVFFETDESLDAADSDTVEDIYMRVGGTVTPVSPSPGPSACSFSSGCPATGNGVEAQGRRAVSDDGHRMFFETHESLVAADTDTRRDVYEWHDGAISLVSTGPTDPGTLSSDFGNFFAGASPDGTHVFFSSPDRLVGEDVDTCGTRSCLDMYERVGGTTRLVSAGSPGGNGPNDVWWYHLEFVSDDGSRVFFQTNEQLVVEDVNSDYDVYERSGGTTKVVGLGSNGLSGSTFGASFAGASADGTRVFVDTFDPLVPEDTDQCTDGVDDYGCIDIYERAGGTTMLVSTGPGLRSCPSFFGCHAAFGGSSRDGTRIFFVTDERLTSDGVGGLYERSGGTTVRVSTGGDQVRVSDDGEHVFFRTSAALVPSDTDGYQDVYDKFNGTTSLVSTGPDDEGECCHSALYPSLVAITGDGARAFFETRNSLLASDVDGAADIYERSGGRTTLISEGPAGNPPASLQTFRGLSKDGTRVFFETTGALVPSDLDTDNDMYERRVAYNAPQSASPLHASVVPVFRQCGTGSNPTDGQHSPPLGTAACLPPLANIGQVAHIGPQSTGAVTLTVVEGDSDPGNGDQANVLVNANLADVQTAAGADYAPNPGGPDVTLVYRFRNTDLDNCSGSGCSGPFSSPATATDFDLSVPIDCTPTAGPEGASCAANTSADSVVPNMIHENKQTVAQIFRLRLNDSGANAVRGDADDRIFATQGVYIP
jgi:hypothetical protein